jgi:hypothetical protein
VNIHQAPQNQASNRKSIYIATTSECVIASGAGGFEERIKTAIRSNNETDLVDDPKDADLIIINQVWKGRNWNDIEILESCAFIQQFSEKILVVSHDDNATIFFPGLYVSLTPQTNWANWVMPCSYKKQYLQLGKVSESGSTTQKRFLFSFRGADFSHPIRKKMTSCLSGRLDGASYAIFNKEFHSHTMEEHEKYVQEILASYFVLCPRGLSPSSYRMFEAMQYGVCPVIISDDWQPIEGIDWDNCSVRIPERIIQKIPEILNSRVADSKILGLKARKVWEAHFADSARERKMLEELLSLSIEVNRLRDLPNLGKLWRSNRFRWAHGWTFQQRALQKITTAADTLRSGWQQ